MISSLSPPPRPDPSPTLSSFSRSSCPSRDLIRFIFSFFRLFIPLCFSTYISHLHSFSLLVLPPASMLILSCLHPTPILPASCCISPRTSLFSPSYFFASSLPSTSLIPPFSILFPSCPTFYLSPYPPLSPILSLSYWASFCNPQDEASTGGPLPPASLISTLPCLSRLFYTHFELLQSEHCVIYVTSTMTRITSTSAANVFFCFY